MGKRKKRKLPLPKVPKGWVPIRLTTLKLLCLNVDYRLNRHGRDRVEGLSLALAHRHRFDTHKFSLSRGYNVGACWDEDDSGPERWCRSCEWATTAADDTCPTCGGELSDDFPPSDAETYDKENPR